VEQTRALPNEASLQGRRDPLDETNCSTRSGGDICLNLMSVKLDACYETIYQESLLTKAYVALEISRIDFFVLF